MLPTSSFHSLLLLLLASFPLQSEAGYVALDSCGDLCYIANKTRELTCGRKFEASEDDTPVFCNAVQNRGGFKLTIGNYETKASRIREGGLDVFKSYYPALPRMDLELKLTFDKIEAAPLKGLLQLENLTLSRLQPDSIDPCLFVDSSFSGRIKLLHITCMGNPESLFKPIELFWPVFKPPPHLVLKKCGLKPECYQCKGPYRGLIWSNNQPNFKGGMTALTKMRRKNLGHCQENMECPKKLIDQCKIRPSTTLASTTTKKPSTLARKAEDPYNNEDESVKVTRKPSVPAAATENREQFGGKEKPQLYESKKESDTPNLSQLVEALGRRTQRTQRFLVVILVISVINSLVLIALLVYLFRRSRFCCGRSKGIYVITKKDPPKDAFLENNGKAS